MIQTMNAHIYIYIYTIVSNKTHFPASCSSNSQDGVVLVLPGRLRCTSWSTTRPGSVVYSWRRVGPSGVESFAKHKAGFESVQELLL